MSTKIMTTFILSLVLTLSLAACGGGNGGGNSGGNNTTTSDDPNTISMSNNDFNAAATTIATDSSLTLVADTFVPHFIANGTWNGDTAAPAVEAGTPVVDNLHIEGNQSATIGPFTTPGTFDFYCTIHPGMNLTVTVQ